MNYHNIDLLGSTIGYIIITKSHKLYWWHGNHSYLNAWSHDEVNNEHYWESRIAIVKSITDTLDIAHDLSNFLRSFAICMKLCAAGGRVLHFVISFYVMAIRVQMLPCVLFYPGIRGIGYYTFIINSALDANWQNHAFLHFFNSSGCCDGLILRVSKLY